MPWVPRITPQQEVDAEEPASRETNQALAFLSLLDFESACQACTLRSYSEGVRNSCCIARLGDATLVNPVTSSATMRIAFLSWVRTCFRGQLLGSLVQSVCIAERLPRLWYKHGNVCRVGWQRCSKGKGLVVPCSARGRLVAGAFPAVRRNMRT